MPDNDTHPLMPGVRCAGINNPYWPRTLHDEQITGFSPLVCGMRSAPGVWASVDVGGDLAAIDAVTLRDGRSMLLVRDAGLRLVSTAGEVVWELPGPGELCYLGDLRGTGQAYLLLGSGPRLWLVDVETGRVEWAHVFEPPHAHVRVAVGNVLPDRSGLEAAVFLAYDGNGCLLHFPQEGEPEFVWERLVVGEGEWPERHDHGCHIQLDLSRPELPVIWNVRHHRCRGVCARTGDSLSHIIYEIGGGFRRNYGPWDVGVGPGGQPLICVVADRVQTHVHAVGLRTDGPNELLWQHYYGELYVVPGVATERLAIADLDGDGATEVAYNVRDPEQDFRSADGSALWRTRLGMTTAYNGRAIAWNAGLFLPGPRAGVAVSVNNDLRTIEGTYLLDGLTGEVVWHKGLHREGDRVRPFLPHGIMTAYDVDGDGLEEVGMDMLSYMAFLNGEDGSFACLYPTRNLDQEGGLYAGDLYNSYVPMYETPEADRPHWLVPLGGYGSFGLMCPDPHEGVWMEDPGYDVPQKVGVVDVDGDGVAEVGYVINNSGTFCCRDLWTGAARWEVALPEPPNSPVMAADVDGDGKGEFLVGRWCIGTDGTGQGEIRWISPVAMGWAVIADFDGDGLGEIACGGSGKIYILKGE